VKPKAAKIKNVIKDNYRIRTFVLDGQIKSKPGQFAMLWLPRHNEKPIAIIDNDPLTFTVAKVGPFTTEIHTLKVGDTIWYRGPYGNNYNLRNKKKVLLVGGGYGVAAMYDLAKRAKEKGIVSNVIIGARSKRDVIFEKLFDELQVKSYVTTEDGSKGFKGFSTQLAENLLQKEGFDAIYSAGPEKMMFAIGELADRFKLFYELSVERFMKCGGQYLCGHCELNGYLTCVDGPVFNWKLVKRLSDFGFFHRDRTATKIPI
jgi:dihydroorotate dehydrogenase electron transfer subunit